MWNNINNNRYTDIITNTQIGNQIRDREKWDLNNLQTTGGASESFSNLK